MKKIVLSLSLVCLTIISANAQVAIMPEAGINLSNLAVGGNVINAKSYSQKFKPGVRGGISLAVPIGKVTFFQPGLFFSSKGAKSNYYDMNYMVKEQSTNINYLEVPLNFGYMSNFGKGGSFFMTAGPYLGIGLSANYSSTDNGKSNIPFGSYGLKELDMGLNFGFGYKLPVGIFLRAQYGIGFMNISNESAPAATSLTNHGFAFTAGYYYTLKTAAQRAKSKAGLNK